ncbi:MAG: SCO family protein [Alphaproteobacteria bacterium]|nr:SCO family protein [Alphaproteobacteria bacterium]
MRGLVVAMAALAALVVVLGYRLATLERAEGESGRAAIGGPFSLTDHNGRRVSDRDFRGKLLLVFFGFTYCPDICPTELQTISVALDELGPQAARVQPIFITVDPDRDDPPALADYLGNFHPSFVGLTGTPEEIAAVARAYRVYYAKARLPNTESEYTMDHSAFVYLMDGEGRYRAHFSSGVAPEKIVAGIRSLL